MVRNRGEDGRHRRRLLRWLAPGLCILASALSLWIGARLFEEPVSEAPASREEKSVSSAAHAEAGEDAGESSARMDAGESDARMDAGAKTFEVEEDVSADTFLSALDRGARTGLYEEVSCSWSSDQAIDKLARSVLLAYRDLPHVQLATSGYLDLKGNTWGAIVFGPNGWVDIVTVAAEEGDASSTARVVRMVAMDGAAGDAGG